MTSKVTTDVEAQIALDKIKAHQTDLDEFNKLGSKNVAIREILLIIAPFVLLLIANNFFEIESELFQVLCILFFASSCVQIMVTAESKKTNRRIDLLHKMLKQDQSNRA